MNQARLNSLRRINVIGTSGCGKSTFSQKLASILNVPYLEIDKIFWGPAWSEPSDEIFFKKLETELGRECWILDGNYTRTVPVKWKNVQTVIWLDYSFMRVMGRAIKRALWRVVTGVEIWEGTGNRETLKMLFGRDSIVLWSLKTFHANRKKYNEVINDKNYAHIKFVRLSGPRQAQHFLELTQKQIPAP
jgi:adenylate kinase family enzyme